MKLSKEVIKLISLIETGPVGGEEDGALKFVFKFPKSGSFTADFLDGTKVTFDEVDKLESSGKFAFVGKGGKVFQTWDSKPSKDDALDVLHRIKGPKTKL